MGHNDIGNPFKLISATEALLVAWEARVYNPPPDMPESRLASLLSHRLSQLESRIDRASSQWPRSTTAPGQDYVESSPDSESELIEEYRQVHAQLLSEFERLRSEHISRYGSCISTGLATDRLVAVYAQVRDCMAACLHAAMINKERSENVDKSIAMAALRYINGYSGIHMNWPIAIDVHNTARLLSVVPDDDEMPLSDTAIAEHILRCLEEGGPTSRSVLKSIQQENDLAQICLQIVHGIGVNWAHEAWESLESIGAHVAITKEILLHIVPDTMHNDLTPQQVRVETAVRQLTSQIEGTRSDPDEPLTDSEFSGLAEKYSQSSALADSLGHLGYLRFQTPEAGHVFNSDLKEVQDCFRDGHFKAATVLSGSLLEILLKEFLVRHAAAVRELLRNDSKSILGSDPPKWVIAEDLQTWTLDPLIKASSRIAMGSSLKTRWDDLKRARNSVHGRMVDKPTAAFALSTVVITAELVFPGG